MSISIDNARCQGCGRCMQVCPGSLLFENKAGKAELRYPRDCWGCTACLKECRFGAIRYFLGPDIGGIGAYAYIVQAKTSLEWHFVNPAGTERIIAVSKGEANKY